MTIVVNITSPTPFASLSRFVHIEGTIGHLTVSGETVTSITGVSLSFNGSAFSSTGVTFGLTSWSFTGFVPTNAPTNATFSVTVQVDGKVQEIDRERHKVLTFSDSGTASTTYFTCDSIMKIIEEWPSAVLGPTIWK